MVTCFIFRVSLASWEYPAADTCKQVMKMIAKASFIRSKILA
jgi:hypothetical protein